MSSRKCWLNVVVAAACLLMVVQVGLADGPKGTAVIKGKVEGAPGKPKAISASADAYCKNYHSKKKGKVLDQSTLVYPNKAVPYVFVYVKNIKDKYEAPSSPAVIDQKGCQYYPHVFGMIAGQELHIKSSDDTAHNIHALPKKNKEFNVNQPSKGTLKRTGKQTFTKKEMGVKIKCDVHPWMSAWCHVMTHPFFDVTKDHYEFPKSAAGNKDKWGTFEIKELPAGEYEVVAWHEKLGEVKQKVTVGDGETKEITFKFEAKKAEAAQPSRVILASEAKTTAPKKCCAAKKAL